MNDLDPAAVEILLDALADPETTRAEAESLMARLDGGEPEAALAVFRRLHDGRDPAELHAMARLVARWAERPVARAFLPALQAMIAEPELADLNRMVAAGLVEQLGEPVDYPALLPRFRDLDALARTALEAARLAAGGPAGQARLVDRLARMPAPELRAAIEDLAAEGGAWAEPLLVALCQIDDPDTALSALAALERVGGGAAVPALARLAEAAADPTLRAQAALTLSRRPAAPAAVPAGAGDAALPMHSASDWPAIEAYASAPSDRGRLILLAAPRPGGATRDVLSLYLSAAEGFAQRTQLERLGPGDFAALEAECAAAGLPLAAVEAAGLAPGLEAALRHGLAAGGFAQPGFLVWLAALGL